MQLHLWTTIREHAVDRAAARLVIAAVLVASAGPWCGRAWANGGPDVPSIDDPLAQPFVDADAVLTAAKATTWQQGGARYLLIEQDVTIEVGSYGFKARRAVVRIDTQHRPGRLIRHLSVYLYGAQRLGGSGRVSAEARRLLVTVSTTGRVKLFVDLLDRVDGPPDDELVVHAAQRMRRYLTVVKGPLLEFADAGPVYPPVPTVTPGITPSITPGAALGVTPQRPAPAPSETPQRFLPPGGTLVLDWGSAAGSRKGPQGMMHMFYGGVSVAYQDFETRRTVTMRCQSAVIFMAEDAEVSLDLGRIDPKDVRGVYLEENVIVTDGTYTIRAPRVYYDPSQDKAVVLDAVFYTWDVRHQVPIYVRAQTLRQASSTSWTGQGVVLTTSEFAEPHFSIAASTIKVDLRQHSDGTTVPHVDVRDITPQVGKMPIGWLPGFAGDASDIPLRRASVGFDSNAGPQVRTQWDMFGLLGVERPDSVDMTAHLDYRGEHGSGVGVNLDYDKPSMFGDLETYLLVADHDKDDIGGRKVDHDGDTRGFAKWQHRQDLAGDWEMSLEMSFVSDETFLEEFSRSEAEEAKPYETSLYLKNQEDDHASTFLAQYDLIGFTAQTTVLQSPGYTVEKLPELGYYMVGTSLLDDRLTYFGETRATRMRVRAGGDSPGTRGFSMSESMATFGFGPMVDFDTVVAAAGISQSYVTRLDTRHEIQAPIKIGDIDVVPYAAGRVTFYDDDFKAFGGEGDNVRLWGITGARLHTSLTRTDLQVEDHVLNLHGLRHIIEPSADVFLAATTLSEEDLPVYDPDVESLANGAGARVGVRHTFQTRRGGPGRWRRVDWLVVNTDFVARSDDADISADPPRFFSYRPEFSTGGDHFYSDLAWQLADGFALQADATHNFESNQMAQWHSGLVINHRPDLTYSIDYSDIDALSSRMLSLGFTYQLTSKYQIGVNQRWDLEQNKNRRTELILQRELPRWTMAMVAFYDEVDNDTSISIMLIPHGIRSSRMLGAYGR